MIERKFGLIDLDEAKILLLEYELSLAKFKQKSSPDLVFLNLTHIAPNSATYEETSPNNTNSSPYQPPSHNHERGIHGFCGSGGTHIDRFARGRGRRFSNSIQCQV